MVVAARVTRGNLEAVEGSAFVVGCSCGVAVADSARCIAAAEGTVVCTPGRLGGFRCGLGSVLCFRWVVACGVTDATRCLCDALTGDESRLDKGDAKARGEDDCAGVWVLVGTADEDLMAAEVLASGAAEVVARDEVDVAEWPGGSLDGETSAMAIN